MHVQDTLIQRYKFKRLTIFSLSSSIELNGSGNSRNGKCKHFSLINFYLISNFLIWWPTIVEFYILFILLSFNFQSRKYLM